MIIGCLEVPIAGHIQGGSPRMLTAGCSSYLEGSKPANYETLSQRPGQKPENLERNHRHCYGSKAGDLEF